MKYPVTPEENYNLICDELKELVAELENNPNMSEEKYQALLRRFHILNEHLEVYAKMKYNK
jgi:hypothetical protein